jgi:hypothetical protein
MARRSPTRSETSAAVSAPPWQTAATVLIILHLFCLGLGLATNVAGGKSLLAPALFRIPLAQKYLKLLWMNVGYDFHIASPLPEDGTHHLQLSAAAATASESGAALPADLPADDMQPRIRWQRYQQLAYHVAFLDELFAENSDVRTTLPLAIAETWLRNLNAPHEPYVLTCSREPSARLPKAVERAPSKPREGGPRLAGPTVYATETVTIYLVWDPETASYQGSRAEAAGQTSEVVRGVTDPAATTGASIETAPDDAESPSEGAAPIETAPPIETATPAIDPAAPEATGTEGN